MLGQILITAVNDHTYCLLTHSLLYNFIHKIKIFYERKHSMIPLYGYDVARTLPVCDHDVAVTAGDQAVAKMVIFMIFTLMVSFH